MKDLIFWGRGGGRGIYFVGFRPIVWKKKMEILSTVNQRFDKRYSKPSYIIYE